MLVDLGLNIVKFHHDLTSAHPVYPLDQEHSEVKVKEPRTVSVPTTNDVRGSAPLEAWKSREAARGREPTDYTAGMLVPTKKQLRVKR